MIDLLQLLPPFSSNTSLPFESLAKTFQSFPFLPWWSGYNAPWDSGQIACVWRRIWPDTWNGETGDTDLLRSLALLLSLFVCKCVSQMRLFEFLLPLPCHVSTLMFASFFIYAAATHVVRSLMWNTCFFFLNRFIWGCILWKFALCMHRRWGSRLTIYKGRYRQRSQNFRYFLNQHSTFETSELAGSSGLYKG